MRRKFLTNLILLLFLNLLIKPFWILGIDRTVQNTVGAGEYGFYFAIFNFSFLFNILLDFGITNFNNRNIAQNNHLLNKHFSSILALKFILAGLYMLITLIFGWIIGYNNHQMSLLALLGINQFLISFVLYLRSNISGLQLFSIDSIMSVLDRVLMIVFCGILLWGNVTSIPFSIDLFVYTQTLAYLLTAFVALIIVIRKAKFNKLKWSPPFFLIIIKQSFPFAILVLLMTFYNRIDSVMIERIIPDAAGDEQAGIYASAYRLLDATNMIAYLFSVLLLPLFSRMIKLKENIGNLAKLSFTLLFLLSILVSASSFFYSHDLMSMLYPQHPGETIDMFNLRMQQTSTIFGVLMFGFIPISTTYVFGTLLTANGNLKQLNIVAASGMALNILLNLILIPKFLATGAAYVSILTQFLSASVQVLIAFKVFKLKFGISYYFRIISYALLVFIFGYISTQLNLLWMQRFIILIVAALVFAFATRLLKIKALINIIKKEESL